jgi:HEAT repeat protein
MAKPEAQIRQQLSDIEPSERTYAGLDASDVGTLVKLIDDKEGWLAARAVHALSHIDAAPARRAVLTAAHNPRLEVRVAAATSAGRLPAQTSDEVLTELLDDAQPAVRKFAVRSMSSRNSEQLRRRVADIAAQDADPRVRRTAEEHGATLADE